MNVDPWKDVNFNLKKYATRGSKESRRGMVIRCEKFLVYCKGNGAKHPSQVSNKMAHQWMAEANTKERYYAVRLVWTLLGRGEPPKPAALKNPPSAVEAVDHCLTCKYRPAHFPVTGKSEAV